MKNGKLVAVKKLALAESRRTKEDFASEVTLISNVHHRNLVRLLGCCSKGPELLLVYEYMANSSLDRFLFGKHRVLPLLSYYLFFLVYEIENMQI